MDREIWICDELIKYHQETINRYNKEIETLDSIIKYQLDQIKVKDATIAELESRLEQSVDISVVNELNETIKAKDAVIAEAREYIKLGEQCIKYETFKDWQSLAKAWLEANK